MTVHRNLRSDRNNAFLQTGLTGPRRRSQGEFPDLSLSAHFHRRVRPGQADAAFNRARELKFFILVAAPTMVGHNPNRRKNEKHCADQNEES